MASCIAPCIAAPLTLSLSLFFPGFFVCFGPHFTSPHSDLVAILSYGAACGAERIDLPLKATLTRDRVGTAPGLSLSFSCIMAALLCSPVPCPDAGPVAAAPKPGAGLNPFLRSTVPPFAPNRSGYRRKGCHPPKGEPRPPSSPSIHSNKHDPFLGP
ncbi:hypothetical protein TARUN_5564 [Trichoderma arundinaceum]|uniref:Uncharacterized protein n=1 Tax=Trichoderma arundinaceum TaxID=490622 RepID=A0A395NKW2_TRIAR|nr:hypothetical protein TARUN_5564 [Trichoderma arundinaceum]